MTFHPPSRRQFASKACRKSTPESNSPPPRGAFGGVRGGAPATRGGGRGGAPAGRGGGRDSGLGRGGAMRHRMAAPSAYAGVHTAFVDVEAEVDDEDDEDMGFGVFDDASGKKIPPHPSLKLLTFYQLKQDSKNLHPHPSARNSTEKKPEPSSNASSPANPSRDPGRVSPSVFART
jgi:hypothetical protein